MSNVPDDVDDSDEFAAWLNELASISDEDEVFAVLAGQRPPSSRLARQQLRGRLKSILEERFKELGSGASAAKVSDAWLHENGETDGLQGQGFVVETIAPWGSSVNGAAVLDEVVKIFDFYVHASEWALNASALWAAYTHVYDCFGVSPILDYSSPTRRCGKSSAVVVQRHLCRAPLLSGNITPAAIFRAVEAWKPTLLIDEADTFAKMNDELRGILNAGHTRDTAFVVRAEGESNEPRLFSTWAPKLVAAIGRLPDTIEDRSIRIVLTRKPVSIKKRDAFDPDSVRRDCEEIRQQLARFALDERDAIASADVERPDGLNDRAWNNWRPLFAIAATAGGKWPERTKDAALALVVDDDDAEDVSTLALRHVWEVLQPAEKLATAEILRHLVSKDEGPWAKWWESHLSKDELKSPAARLARLLKPFGIKPRQVWIGGQNVRGYDIEDFKAPSVSVYLAEDARTLEHARPGSSAGAGSSVSYRPSVFSEGDEGYLPWLYAKFEAGLITEAEWHRADKAHRSIVATRETT